MSRTSISAKIVQKSYEVLAIINVCEAALGCVREKHVGEDTGNIACVLRAAHRLAGEVHDVVEGQQVREERDERRRAQAGTEPDPILAAFEQMDELSAVLDRFADNDGWVPQNSADLKAWEDAAVKAANTVPTTKAGLIDLLDRLSADIERGPSIWQRDAADTARSAVANLLKGGEHV